MEAERNPLYLKAVAAAVVEFRETLAEFLEMHVINDSYARGIAPAVLPRDGVDSRRAAEVHARVNVAAGKAGVAPSLTGMYITVQGAGPIDPIAAWETMTRPQPLLEPSDVVGACHQMVGRLEAMRIKAEAEAPPKLGEEALHPLVWGAARRLWRDGHYRVAVSAAAEALVTNVKTVTGRNDVPETSLWQETFSAQQPTVGRPRLRWPGEPSDRDVKTMNEGLRFFAPGVQLTIRNPAAHGSQELTEQEALERLASLSLLARWVDECDLDKADEPTA